MMELVVTPKNHHEWDRDISQYHYQYNDVLEAHLSINEYLDEKLARSSRIDWAGKYATWLNNFGIHHESKNGWWSKKAVMPENIGLFIEEMTTESDRFHEVIGSAKQAIKRVEKAGRFTAEKDTVIEIVYAITGEQL